MQGFAKKIITFLETKGFELHGIIYDVYYRYCGDTMKVGRKSRIIRSMV